MICNKCGSRVPEDSEFCQYCGNKIKPMLNCPNCGKILPDDSDYCPYCGSSINKKSLRKKAKTTKPKKSKKIFLILIPIILIFGIAGTLFYMYNSGYFEKETAEKSYDYSSQVNDDVYIYVNEVRPEIGVYNIETQKNSYVFCECKGLRFDKMWLYISVDDYHKYFDANAAIDYNDGSPYGTVSYGQIITIHGTLDLVGNICPDIESTTDIENTDKVVKFTSVDIPSTAQKK